MNILLAAVAPVAIILLYIYYRDKYEKEPIKQLLKALAAGMFIVIPVIFVETFLGEIRLSLELPSQSDAFFNAFGIAAFSEEIFKFIAFLFIIWKSKDYNERFDGIVYAVFISLGFALVENIKYLMNYGNEIALMRGVLAVPAHALFGVTMGYYFSLSKFSSNKKDKVKFFYFAIIFPIILHGSYDFILMANEPMGMLAFVPFIIFLWKTGFKRMNILSENSRFKK
ncbi:MAG: PrsW family intramembrane metalloprotease [Bacteroidetes bacterium]|nr:MAG: PrsW family intramembrane metalloprotease [Bacteroidota bacterium]